MFSLIGILNNKLFFIESVLFDIVNEMILMFNLVIIRNFILFCVFKYDFLWWNFN